MRAASIARGLSFSSSSTNLNVPLETLATPSVEGPRYAMSRIEVTAPQGRWDWLNRRLIVGTLQGLRPRHAAVLIRGWLLTIGAARSTHRIRRSEPSSEAKTNG